MIATLRMPEFPSPPQMSGCPSQGIWPRIVKNQKTVIDASGGFLAIFNGASNSDEIRLNARFCGEADKLCRGILRHTLR
jgi:hypothetical protein